MKLRYELNVQVVVEPDKGEYVAYCPALKGLYTCGPTESEALKNVVSAIQAYVISLAKHHEPIPCCRIIKENEFHIKKRNLFSTNVPIPAFA